MFLHFNAQDPRDVRAYVSTFVLVPPAFDAAHIVLPPAI